MKLIKVFAICLALSSLAALAQTSTRAIDLSKLELLNRIVVPGHGLGSFPGTAAFGLGPFTDKAAFSPNGKGLVTRDTLGILIWWEVSTGEQLQRWKLPNTFQLRGFIDRQTVLLLENEKRFKLFDLETGKMRPDPRNGLDAQPEWAKFLYSPDKTVYLMLYGDYPILSDAKTKKLIRRFGHVITDFAIALNGDVITGSQAGTMRTWNAITSKEISRFTGADAEIEVLDVSPNNQFIATISSQKIVQIWNRSGQKLFEIIKSDYFKYDRELFFSNDSEVFAINFIISDKSQHSRNQLVMYRTRDGSRIALPPVNKNSSLYFVNRSDAILQEEVLWNESDYCNSQRRLSMIRVDTGNVIWVGDWRKSRHQDWVFSPDGTVFARHLETYNIKNELDRCEESPVGTGQAIDVSGIDSQTGNGLGWFKIPSYYTSEQGYPFRPRLAQIAPDNQILLTTTYSEWEGIVFMGVSMHDLKTGKRLTLPSQLTNSYNFQSPRGANPHLPKFKFSPDGRYLMVWTDNRIDVWGTRDRQAIFKGR